MSILDSVKRLIWVRNDAIGDTVLSLPALRLLKERRPDMHVTVVCLEHTAVLYEPCAFVDDIYSYKNGAFSLEILDHVRALKPDAVVNSIYSRNYHSDLITLMTGADVRIGHLGRPENIEYFTYKQNNALYTHLAQSPGEWKSELARHEDFLRFLGVEPGDLRPEIYLTAEDEGFAEDFFQSKGLDPEATVALFAGVLWPGRLYTGYGQAIGDVCAREGLAVVVLGGPADEEANRANLEALPGIRTEDLTGQCTLRRSAAVLKRCRIAVGAETGLAHIACAEGTPNVILLGGGHFGRFMPYSPLTTAVSLPLECFRCSWRCRYGSIHCIAEVAPEVITRGFERGLEEPGDSPKLILQGKDSWHPYENEPVWSPITAQGVEVETVDPETAVARADQKKSTRAFSKAMAEKARELLVHEKEGDALQLLLRTLKKDPLFSDALGLLGNILCERGEPDQGIPILQDALRIDPENQEARYFLEKAQK